jgi:hypothetical protein
MVDEVCGTFGHPSASTARTEPATFARERDEPIAPAGGAPEPREAAGEPAASEKRPELFLDEPWQPLALAQRRRLHAKCLEMIADDLIEDALTGAAWFVLGGPAGHVLAGSPLVPHQSSSKQARSAALVRRTLQNLSTHTSSTIARFATSKSLPSAVR